MSAAGRAFATEVVAEPHAQLLVFERVVFLPLERAPRAALERLVRAPGVGFGPGDGREGGQVGDVERAQKGDEVWIGLELVGVEKGYLGSGTGRATRGVSASASSACLMVRVDDSRWGSAGDQGSRKGGCESQERLNDGEPFHPVSPEPPSAARDRVNG